MCHIVSGGDLAYQFSELQCVVFSRVFKVSATTRVSSTLFRNMSCIFQVSVRPCQRHVYVVFITAMSVCTPVGQFHADCRCEDFANVQC